MRDLIGNFLRLTPYPSLFILLICLVHLIAWVFHLDTVFLGVYPREFIGLIGVLFGPLVHSDFSHLISNSVPISLLGSALYYGYPKHANRVLLSIYVFSGLLIWFFARPAYHIGASGVVYGLFGFVTCAGLLSKNNDLAIISLTIFFIYGGVLYGLIPQNDNVSWEAHLFGLVVGVVLSLFFVKPGETNKPDESINVTHTLRDQSRIHYNYRNKDS